MNKILLSCTLMLTSVLGMAQTTDSTQWRNVFTDPQLQGLIDSALLHNADLRSACLNVEQAQASLRAARLSFVPSLSIGAEGALNKAGNAAAVSTYNIPLTMQWELDLSGRLRGEKRAAVAEYWNTAMTEQAVRLQIISAVTSCYYTLIMIDEQIEITRESIENAQHTVRVMEALKEVSMQDEAAVSQAKAALYNVQATEKSLVQQMMATENAMCLLIGQRMDNIERNTGLTGLNVEMSDSYELSCLSERPDVMAAEYALKAQMAQVDVAQSAFYPSLTISAQAGWTNNIGEIVNPGQILLSAVTSLVQPLFNRGQNKANLQIARSREEQALTTFNQTLLTAGTELSDALTACRLSNERLELRSEEVKAAERAYEVSRELMQNSSSTYLEVLTAQSALLQSRLLMTTDRMDLIQGEINLFKALGGKM